MNQLLVIFIFASESHLFIRQMVSFAQGCEKDKCAPS